MSKVDDLINILKSSNNYDAKSLVNNYLETRNKIRWTSIGVTVFFTLVFGGMWGCPQYNVWQQGLSGQAELARAEQNRQIKIEEAKAVFEAATYKRRADSIRAVGVAEANRIIASSLTPEYIKWKWVEGLHDGSSEVIYVPTEANIPLLEATRKIGGN